MSTRTYYSEATLGDFIGDIWAAKFLILGGGLAGLCAALLFLTLAVPHYRAAMIVGPVIVDAAEDAETESLGFARFETILRGPSVAEELRRQGDMAAGIAQARRWRFASPPDIASAAEMAEYLADHVHVEPVGSTPLRRIVYDHPDPVFAAQLLRRLYGSADKIIHVDSRARAGERAAQLETALAQTQNPEHRRKLTDTLMKQEQERTILALDQPFAAIVAEPPAAGPRPYWPRAALVMPVLVLVGMFAGFALSCLRRRPA